MPPELLSPAGSLDAALAAFRYGADAVYLGLPRFSARAEADNLTPERVRALLAHARALTPARKIYVTFNTLVLDAELPQALDTLDVLNDLAPDGVIVQDLGVARLIRDHFPRLPLHASTQLAAHNLDGVLALKALGFTRVVLARELTLDEISQIVRASGVEIEVFVHGALCYSISGLCLFSSQTTGRSGNRGRCAYCCRAAFQAEGPASDSAAPACYPFSMMDLALAPLLDRVAATGAHSLKIEGRMKSPLYVACVTDYYRQKLDGRLTPAAERALIQDLQTVFSRPWTRLYAEGPGAAADTLIDPVAIGHRGAYIGTAEAVFRDRDGVRWLRFKTNRALEKHDGLQAELAGGGKPFGCAIHALRAAGSLKPVITLPAGTAVEVALPEDDVPRIPPGAPLFCSASQAVRRRYEIPSLREAALPAGHAADIRVSLSSDGITVRARSASGQADDVRAEFRLPLALTASRQPEQTLPAVRKAFERLGDTAWRLGALELDDPDALYAPLSKLNEARRGALAALTAEQARLRARRRDAVADAWQFALPANQAPGDAVPPAAEWSLKLRAGGPLLPADALEGIGTLVLAIGHLPADELGDHLARWSARFARENIRLALPLITRTPETDALKQTLRALVRDGWTNWECAELSGCRMLREEGVPPVSADWSFYALNRVAAAELASLGIRRFVLSPENSIDHARDLAAAPGLTPTAELLVYQHTPLFLSETAPCLPQAPRTEAVSLSDRRGRVFTTRRLDNLWVTVLNAPLCLADRAAEAGTRAWRVDLSWSPDGEDVPALLRTLLSGRCPAGTHAGQADRDLA